MIIQEALFTVDVPKTPIAQQTKVVHCKREKYDVYIGRAVHGLKGSIWGNPFHIGKDGTREEVIEKYRQYVLGNPELLAQLEELRGQILGCWCSPQKCHGDVLVELLSSGIPPTKQHGPYETCCKKGCREDATLKSPGGSVYCKKHGYCGGKYVKETALGISVKVCGKSVEQFVMHPRLGIYVCPCILAFEKAVEEKR